MALIGGKKGLCVTWQSSTEFDVRTHISIMNIVSFNDRVHIAPFLHSFVLDFIIKLIISVSSARE